MESATDHWGRVDAEMFDFMGFLCSLPGHLVVGGNNGENTDILNRFAEWKKLRIAGEREPQWEVFGNPEHP